VVTNVTLQGRMTSSITRPLNYAYNYTISYWCPTGTEPLSSTIIDIYASKYIQVTTLTSQGHVTATVTWPFVTPGVISYRCYIVTEYDCQSPAILEIIDPIQIGVTIVTFIGHVPSSATWPIDSPYAISYWCLIGTESLSSSIFEIFASKYI